MLRILIAFFILGSMVSCKKDKIELPPDVGYDYAPTIIGKYVIYEVDSVVYDDFKKDTTIFKYRIKEKLEENITDAEGRAALKLVRYIKLYNPSTSYDNIPWTLKDVWTCIRTKTTYEVVEEDIRFTKLTFPVVTDKIWNGNAFNTFVTLDYKYKYTDKAETINGIAFDNVLFVEQKDDKLKNVIHREYYIEKYAKNIGLIYREIKDLKSETVNALPVEQRIKSGIIYKQIYISHGIE